VKKRFTLANLMFLLSLCVVFMAGVLVWSTYQFFTEEFPDVASLRNKYPVVHYQGKNRPPKVTLQRAKPASWIKLHEASKMAVGAIIVSEDWAFYQHQGYDANQIKEAIKEDWEAGRFVRGASTITQQVVKNVFLEKDKNLWRKLKELILAVRLENSTSKRKILETYINIAEWGEGIFGINAAAQNYFNKHPSQLTAKESAFLAMLLPSPKRHSQSFKAKKLTDYAKQTVQSILDKMTQAKYITEEERNQATYAPLSFEIASDIPL